MPDTSAPSALYRLGHSRWLRYALWAVLAWLLLWLLSWWLVPVLGKGPLERKASELLGRQVTVGALEFKPWTLEITLRQLAVAGREGAAPQLEIERIYADVELQSLVRLGPVVDALTVDAPHLRVALLADGEYDVDDILARLAPPADAPPSKPARMALYNITLNNGAVEVQDRSLNKTHTARAIALAVPFISTLPSQRDITVEPQLAFELEGSHFSSTAAATPFTQSAQGAARIQWKALDLAPYLPYLPASLPVKVQGAVVDLDLNLAFEQLPEVALKVTGSAQASDVTVADRQGQPLVAWDKLDVKLADVRPLAQVARIASVEVDGAVLHASRSEDGTLRLAALAAPTEPVAAEKDQAGKTNGASGTGWAVSVDEIALRAGRVLWTDASTQPAAALEAQNLTLNARDLAIPFAQPGKASADHAPKPLSFDGSADLPTGSLAFKGQTTGHSADVAVSLEGLSLAMAQPYLAAFLEPTLTGTLDGQVGVQWQAPAADPSAGTTGIKINAGPVSLSTLAIAQDNTTLAALEKLSVDGAKIDLDARSVNIDQVALTKPTTSVERAKDGRWSFERWAKTATPTADADAAAASPSAAWQIAIADASVDGASISFADRAQTRPVAFELYELKLRAQNLTPDGKQAQPLEFSARMSAAPQGNKRGSQPASGTLAFKGKFTPEPLSAVGKIDASALPVHTLDGYLADSIAIELLQAEAGFKGDLNFAQTPRGSQLSLKGDAAIDNLRANSTAASTEKTAAQVGQQLLAWKRLGLQGLSVAVAPETAPRIEVKETSLSDFFARITIDETGTINLTQLTQKPGDAVPIVAAQTPTSANKGPAVGESNASAAEDAPAAQPAAAAPAAPADPLAVQLSFGPISFVNGKVAFSDFFIKPNYSADLSDLTGRLSAFATQIPGGEPVLADLELRGLAEGSAALEITGQLNPLAKPLALDINGKVRDLELPPLSPYSVKYAGHGIERGRMSVDVHYKILPNGQLTATNQLVLKQLRFGEKVEGAPASLPVKLAVALLADSNGVIDLNLPISGSLNDPQFSLGPVIFKAIVGLIGKAITAPFSLLANALGGGDSLSTVVFAPGQSAIAPEAQAGLDKLAKALADRPALKLTVTGTASLEQEREAIARNRLRDQVRAQMQRESGADSQAPMEPAQYAKFLQRVYDDSDMPKPRNMLGIAQTIAVPDMEALLLAQQRPATSDMATALAEQRAQAVKDYLAGQKVPKERLFVAAPKLLKTGDTAEPQAQLSLVAQ